jgi:hypothetical protein
VKAVRNLFKCTTIEQLPDMQRKALSGFQIGNSILITPEISDRVPVRWNKSTL